MKIKKKSNVLRVPPLQKPIKVKRGASDVEEGSTVHKALENVKKVLEKKNVKHKKVEPTLKKGPSVKTKNVAKPYKKTRGLVYVGHIPHGFYEEQMQDYFQQFGRVTRVRVVRSRNTGKSRGYGYVEFLHPEVAEIAAEAMNNYLMCDRLLKATYIPPEKQHKRFFAGNAWSKQMYPKLRERNLITRKRNMIIDESQHKRYVQHTEDKLLSLEKKLKEKGIDLKFKAVNALKS